MRAAHTSFSVTSNLSKDECKRAFDTRTIRFGAEAKDHGIDQVSGTKFIHFRYKGSYMKLKVDMDNKKIQITLIEGENAPKEMLGILRKIFSNIFIQKQEKDTSETLLRLGAEQSLQSVD